MTSSRPPRPSRDRHADEIAEAVDRATRRFAHAAGVERARQVRGMMLDVVARAATSLRRKPNVCAITSGMLRVLAGGACGTDRRSAAPGRCVSANQRLAQQVHAAAARNRPDVDVGRRRAGHLQAACDRARRKAGDVLDAAEALLFERRDERAVAQHGGGHIAVIGVEPDDQHAVSATLAGVGRGRQVRRDRSGSCLYGSRR